MNRKCSCTFTLASFQLCTFTVRNFTQVRFHVLNSLNYVAVFQRALIQFSVGGQYFNRHSPPVMLDVRRDIHNRQARWVTAALEHRVGRFLRITLWFDYDWIVLSEVGFESSESSACPSIGGRSVYQSMVSLIFSHVRIEHIFFTEC